jgi:sugar phosphate isomerase/epimerase
MRLSCCAYSYRQALQAGTLSLLDFIRTCQQIGFDGVELTSYYFPTTERGYLNEVKRFAHNEGVLISGTAVGNDFAQPDSAKRKQHIETTKQWIDHSVVLGAPTLRVFAGYVREGQSREEAFGNVVACLKECAEYAWERGVQLALENHDGLTARGEHLMALLKAVDSKAVGVNLDFGNFVGKIYPEMKIVAPYSIASHAKLTARGTKPKTHIEVDYAKVRKILETADYRGWCAIEYEEEEPAEIAVPAFYKKLRSAFH